MGMKLAAKRERFCQEYIVDLNGAAAARRASYAKSGAKQQADKLLKLPEIQARIIELQRPIMDKLEVTQERVLREIALVAFSNMEDFVTRDEKGLFLGVSISELTRDQMAAVSELSVEVMLEKNTDKEKSADRVEKLKLRLSPKLTALQHLGNHLGLFKKGDDDDSLKSLAKLLGKADAVLPPDALSE